MWLDKPPVFFTKYWLLQGILHMNWAERLHRFTLEAVVAYVLWWLANLYSSSSVSWFWPVLVAHTMNAVFNGQAIAVWRHVYGRLPVSVVKDLFMAHLETMGQRLNRINPRNIADVVIMGSIARGELRPTSDVELAVVARPGVWNLFMANNYLMLERIRAFFARFPLDAYVYNSWEELESKMRVQEEPPLHLFKGSDHVADHNPEDIVAVLRGQIRSAVPKAKPPRVILVGAGGGHLTEVLLAVDGVSMKRYVATFCLPHTRDSLKGEVVYCLIDPHGHLLKYLKNFLQSLWMVLRVRPEVVMSTGGGMSIASCLIGKFIGAKLIYVESGARITTPSKTGKLLYKFADLFIVQWEPLLKHYPKAIYGGVLL
jgi:predicted nucleotidyltransferase